MPAHPLFASTPHAALPAVDVAALIGPYDVDPWVARLKRFDSAPSLAVRAVAVGHVGRFALATAASPEAALATRAGGDDGPAARARAWAAALDAEQLKALVALTRAAIGEAFEALDGLTESETPTRSFTPGGWSVEEVRRLRDELESLRFILEAARAWPADLQEAMEHLDDCAQLLVDLFDRETTGPHAGHRDAMARLCPLPWWA